ncbi:serine--tRNA ligase [bacterium]|jgi:seryl-tRNA synthetase|nr:serine--tRNA ligase [bacterium]
MLDIKYIRENLEGVRKNISHRNMSVDLDALVTLDDKRKSSQQHLDQLRSTLKSSSKSKPTPEKIAELKELSQQVKELEQQDRKINDSFLELLKQVPNITHPDSPTGGEEDFNILYKNFEPKNFDFQPKNHADLLVAHDALDFERGTKIAGHKSYFLKTKSFKLNRALIDYGVSILEKNGITEIIETPDFAHNDVIEYAGFNPRGEQDDIYNIEGEDMSLVGTAEITMLGYHSNEVIDLSNGPKIVAAISSCFRKEAGSYGRTSMGLYRVHQFKKLEIFAYCKPEDSDKVHQQILKIEKEIIDGLEIPYQVIDIATGDLGACAYRKYDIEAYMTMKGDENTQGEYGEITSTSNCLDYQARRANIKFVDENGKKQFVHTLNGTAIVTSRFPIALVENHQQADGSIKIPTALQKFYGNTLL